VAVAGKKLGVGCRRAVALGALALSWGATPAATPRASPEPARLPPFVTAAVDGQGRLIAEPGDAGTYILEALDQGDWYRRLLRMPAPHSVAISTRTMQVGGSWGRRGSAAEAIGACGGAASGCRVYLEEDQVVWVPAADDPVPYAALPPGAESSDTATVEGALTGTGADRHSCTGADGALWVEPAGQPACLRYRHGGLSAASGTVLLFLDGDEVFALFRRDGNGISGVGSIGVLAAKRGAILERRVRSIVGPARLPYVILNRPGTGGSSGNQWRDGKTVRETEILDAALDALASRYGVTRWAVAAQSGGAAAAANLLARRRDIACAALGSGPLALRAQLVRQGARGEIVAGLDDPIDHVGAIRADPARRVFVLSDDLDSLVPAAVQRPWAQAAAGHGHAVRHLVRRGWGAGPQHHDLTPQAVLAASLCAQGAATAGIVDSVVAGGPLGRPQQLLRPARTDAPR
jgi:hypothetical protein